MGDRRLITADDLRGLPGLRRTAAAAILEVQPTTVLELLSLPDVGRKTVRALLERGLVSDPTGLARRGMTQSEFQTVWLAKQAVRERHG